MGGRGLLWGGIGPGRQVVLLQSIEKLQDADGFKAFVTLYRCLMIMLLPFKQLRLLKTLRFYQQATTPAVSRHVLAQFIPKSLEAGLEGIEIVGEHS